ncbi:hypothetical protein NMEN93004_0714 [Neisseria meningitidis 93004]|nr:hypothetical protein NMEN93004_0714 [Neisseria meningitidis 93004]
MKPDSMQTGFHANRIPCNIWNPVFSFQTELFKGAAVYMHSCAFKIFLRRVNQPNTFPLLLIVLMACLVSVHKNRQLKTARFL